MQPFSGFVKLLAVAQAALAVPSGSAAQSSAVAPVPVHKLFCDGDSYKCTAHLDYGDGRWVAQWKVEVFHNVLFGTTDHSSYMREIALAPVPAKNLKCDGDTYKCTANLEFGDGRWVAQWVANVRHNGFHAHGSIDDFAPVPVNELTCDGDTYKCTANLDYGDGRWIADWSASVFHESAFSQQ